jgi:hypothetical protein
MKAMMPNHLDSKRFASCLIAVLFSQSCLLGRDADHPAEKTNMHHLPE